MSDFSIHDVKTVEELYDMNDVNRYLKSGWVLLSVGFNTEDEETGKLYILGNTEIVNPKSVDPESRISKLRNE